MGANTSRLMHYGRASLALVAVAAIVGPLVAGPALARGPENISDVAESVIDAVVNVSTKQTVDMRGGQMPHGLDVFGFFFVRQSAFGLRQRQREQEQSRQLGGEGLGRGHADLGTGKRGHHDVAFAGDRRARYIDHRDDVLRLLPGVAQRRQRVRGLA